MPEPGTGNIFSDPLFLDAEIFNFSLQSDSHCIDAGDPAETDPDNTIIDIGAVYFPQENNPEQSGDCNIDGFINVLDIILLINTCILPDENTELCMECGDTNQDGNIDVLDIVSLINLIIS